MQSTDPFTTSVSGESSHLKSLELESLSEELAASTATAETLGNDDEQQPMTNRHSAIRSKFASYFSSYDYQPPRRIGNLFFFCYSKQKLKLSQNEVVLVKGKDQSESEVMVPFICLPYIWMALTSLPVCIITAMMSSMEITGTMQMHYIPFWKAKFPLLLLISYAVYCVLRIFTTNPGVSELVFYEREKAERRKYALNKLREDNLLDQSDSQVDEIIRGQEGSINQTEQPYRMCAHCQIKKAASEAYITHCSICGVCVEDVDHHCVFFGKCIARDNIWYFNCSICLFIVTVAYFVILMLFDGMRAGARNINRLNHQLDHKFDHLKQIHNQTNISESIPVKRAGDVIEQPDMLVYKNKSHDNEGPISQRPVQNPNSSSSISNGKELDIVQITSEGSP